MGLFDGLFSTGLGMIGQYLNVGYQKELQEHAGAVNYKYAEKTARNQPTWNRAGLESAGYNPMLAVQNATSGANAGWTSTGQANPADLAGDYASGISNATNIQHMKNETDQTDSTIKLNEANARNAVQDAISKEIHNKYLDNREQKELGQISAETDKLVRETSYFDQLAENMEAQRRLQEMGINLDYSARIYGADKGYAGTVYNANTNERMNKLTSEVNERNNKRTNRVNTSLEHIRHPYSSFAHRSYTSGKDYKRSYRDPWSQ